MTANYRRPEYAGVQLKRPRVLKQRDDAREVQKCLQCGKELKRLKPSHAAKRKGFCSSACSNRRRLKPCRVCEVCGAEFGGRRLVNQTCSAKCGYELRKSKWRRRRRCLHCDEMFWPERRRRAFAAFCRRACVDAFMAERRKRVVGACARCGLKVNRQEAAVRRKKTANLFCSRECAKEFLRGANSVLYRGGGDPRRGPYWPRIAEGIRKRDGYKCQRCNKTQEENGQRLSVDHVIPWRSFEDKAAANDPSNLTSLCRSCHSKKTNEIERRWLRGDVVGFEQYRRSIQLAPLSVLEAPRQRYGQ